MCAYGSRVVLLCILLLVFCFLLQAVGGDAPRNSPTSTGSITSLASLIFSPFLFIWHMMQTFLFASPQTPPSSNQQQGQPGGAAPKRFVE